MNNTSRSFGSGRGGFTLVELLAALAILAMLMSIVFAVFNQASKAWIQAESRTENFQGSRMALDMMSRDIECAMVGSNKNRQVRLMAFENSGSIMAGATGPYVFSVPFGAVTAPNDALFFVTQAQDSKGSAFLDMAECGYYVIFNSVTGNGMKGGTYYMCRHYLRSNDSGWDIFQNPNTWWTATTGSDTPLLENVVRLEFKYEYGDSTSAMGTSVCQNWNLYGGGPPLVDPTIALPRAVHIQMSILDRRYAAQLAAVNGNAALTPGDLGNLPYQVEALSGPTKQVLREGLRNFYRSVFPRGGGS